MSLQQSSFKIAAQLFLIILLIFPTSSFGQGQGKNEYPNTVSISTWINFENPVTGIKYQNNSSALGYFVNVKTDLDVFMAAAGPSFTVIEGHNVYFGAGSFDGFLVLELGVSVQRRKIAYEFGLDYVPEDKFNFLAPTVGIGIVF